MIMVQNECIFLCSAANNQIINNQIKQIINRLYNYINTESITLTVLLTSAFLNI